MLFFNTQKRQILKTLSCTPQARQNYLDSLIHLSNDELNLPKIFRSTVANPKINFQELNDHKWARLLTWLYCASEKESQELSNNFKKFLIKSRFKVQSILKEQSSIHGWSELKHINSLIQFFHNYENSITKKYYFGASLNSIYNHSNTSTIDRMTLIRLLTRFSEYHREGILVY